MAYDDDMFDNMPALSGLGSDASKISGSDVLSQLDNYTGGWDAGIDLEKFESGLGATSGIGEDLTFDQLEQLHTQGLLADYITAQWGLPQDKSDYIDDYFTNIDYSQLNEYKTAYGLLRDQKTRGLETDFQSLVQEIQQTYGSAPRDIAKMTAGRGLETSGVANVAQLTAEDYIGKTFNPTMTQLRGDFEADKTADIHTYTGQVQREQNALVSNFLDQGIRAKDAYQAERASSGGKK